MCQGEEAHACLHASKRVFLFVRVCVCLCVCVCARAHARMCVA